MKEFKILPSNPDFQNLTTQQINFVFTMYQQDMLEAGKGTSNQDVNSDDWWYADHDDFEPLVEGHDEDAIASKVAKLFTRNTVNGKLAQEAVDERIQANLKDMREKADLLESQGRDKWGAPNEAQIAEKKAFDNSGDTTDSIKNAIAQFKTASGEVVDLPTQDDDFEI
jgi:hypothetical protein